MPRAPRKESETGYYHVMMRGINREYIFKADPWKQHFIELLKQELAESSIALVGWCLMDNHVHLVVKAPLMALSKVIKVISIKYSSYYNRVNRRIGPVFGDRYKSEAIETDLYLMQVLRYIHRNPLKARLVSTMEAYQWSSFKEFFGEAVVVTDHERKLISDLFDNNKHQFDEFYRIEEHQDFLEIKEDRETNAVFYCQQLIEEYCAEHGVVNQQQLRQRSDLFQGLIILLLQKSGLSVRKIALLLEVSHNRIHQASSEGRSQ